MLSAEKLVRLPSSKVACLHGVKMQVRIAEKIKSPTNTRTLFKNKSGSTQRTNGASPGES